MGLGLGLGLGLDGAHLDAQREQPAHLIKG